MSYPKMNLTRFNNYRLLKNIGLNDESISSMLPGSKRRHYRAVLNWLNRNPDSQITMEYQFSDVGEAEGLTEAIYHLCQAQDYASSIQVLETQIQSSISTIPDMSFYSYLLYKGKGSELLENLDLILRGLNDRDDKRVFLIMVKGKALESLGERIKAVQIYQEICNTYMPHTREYIEAFAHIAGCQIQMGQYQRGLPNLNYALNLIEDEIVKNSDTLLTELKVELMEGLALHHMITGRFHDAFDLFGQVFSIRKESGMTPGLISPLGHQGIILRKNAVSRQYIIKMLLVNILKLIGCKWISNILYNKLCKPFRFTINR